jgi:predicted  nucleic acid-binding Zn-ribbon protein
MRDQIAALGTLQQLDLEIKVIEEKLRKYPQEIYRYEEDLENAKTSIAEARKELEQITRNKKEMEHQLEENHLSIKTAEKRLFEIKTYREYEALQKEISQTKMTNATLEEEILQSMEGMENLEKHISDKESELTEREKESEKLIKDYKIKIKDLAITHENKQLEKEKIISIIDPEVLPLYEKIKTRNGIAIAPARNEVCTGCNMKIPPQLFNEILTLSRMIQCPNCGRILYSEESFNGELQTA